MYIHDACGLVDREVASQPTKPGRYSAGQDKLAASEFFLDRDPTYYWGGVVTYSNQAKEVLLGVEPHTLQAFGAVSQETAREMAEGMRGKSRSDYALAITGIAGPEGGSPGKPVGLVYIALAHPGGCEVRELRFGLGRDYIRILSAKSALDLLRRNIQFAC